MFLLGVMQFCKSKNYCVNGAGLEILKDTKEKLARDNAYGKGCRLCRTSNAGKK